MEAESNANDLKQQVVQYCRDFLGDVWSKIDKNEIIYKEIGGGFQNINIFCAIPYHVKQDDVPQKVIVHLYGKDFTGQQSVKFCGEAAETVIIERLSQLNLVPKLFGVFQGGRIEEFIE
ncbi:choline/ethanolamine kinase-like protein, partial [Dinothrombium tinctorium]